MDGTATTDFAEGYNHHRINLSQKWRPAHVSLPGVHSVAFVAQALVARYASRSVTAAHLGCLSE